MQILLVEDNKELSSALVTLLEAQNYIVTSAEDGEEGLYFVKDGLFDVIVLDRMLPKKDGLSVLKEMRQLGINTPVLIMTALGQITNRVEGLDAGADDYIVKPFDNREFFARINALSRRPEVIAPREEICVGDVVLDLQDMTLRGDLGETTLSAKEHSILKLFFASPNQPIARDTLFAKVWGYESEVEYSNIDSYIYYVRRRLKAVSQRVAVTTIHKLGYKLEDKND